MTLNLSSLLMAVVMACGMAGAAMGEDGSGSHLSLCATSTGWAKCPIELTVSDRWTGIAPCKILGDVLTCWPIEPMPSFPMRHVEWIEVEPLPPSPPSHTIAGSAAFTFDPVIPTIPEGYV